MQGKIIKGIAGFYYVYVENKGIYECKAKGKFRNKSIKPLVGDNVMVDIIDEEKKKGNISEILERKNQLIRPAVANVDQAMIVFAVKKPNPNLNLLDRFLVMMEFQNIETIICFNKIDIGDDDYMNQLQTIYQKAGYKVMFASATKEQGVDKIKKMLKGKSTVFAGPSGVGKSSMLNALTKDYKMETGAISEKIGRGKHTTRHSEIFNIDSNSYVFDTPGFSSLFVPGMTKEKLQYCFPEMPQYEPECRFTGCAHINEPDCGIKNALEQGKIARERYENYVLLYKELEQLEKRLIKENIEYKKVSFPNYDSPSSALVKMYLSGEFGKNAKDISPYIASTFYAADRYATFKMGYKEYYDNGGIILADRYTTSNMVHQAGKIKDETERKKFLDWLCDFEFNLYGLPVPSEVFFLNMPVEKSLELIKKRENKFTHESKKDIHERDKDHLKDAYNAACDVAKKYNWYEIKCVKDGEIRSIEDIHEEIYNEIKKHI